MNTQRFYLHDPLLLILSTTILSALFVCHGSNPDAARITENFTADFSGISPAQLCLMLHLGEGAALFCLESLVLPLNQGRSDNTRSPECLSPSYSRDHGLYPLQVQRQGPQWPPPYPTRWKRLLSHRERRTVCGDRAVSLSASQQTLPEMTGFRSLMHRKTSKGQGEKPT